MVGVAQLVRAPVCGTGGCGFKSHHSPKNFGVWRSPVSAPALGAGGQRFESSNSDQFYNPTMAKKKENVYTGTEIIGIAQMHKSNAVPVRGKKQATEVANMRRN